jgi:hypothetical protein
MENLERKADFLKRKYIPLLEKLDPETPKKFGKMNVQQMVEHMADYFRVGAGMSHNYLVTPAEHIDKYQEFLRSEKPFRENTPNSLLPETPVPPRHDDVKNSINELKHEVENFFQVFEEDALKTVTNPFFGDLSYEMSVQLLYKHALHHLKQFGIEVPAY